MINTIKFGVSLSRERESFENLKGNQRQQLKNSDIFSVRSVFMPLAPACLPSPFPLGLLVALFRGSLLLNHELIDVQ
jgi:hypothetical protein